MGEAAYLAAHAADAAEEEPFDFPDAPRDVDAAPREGETAADALAKHKADALRRVEAEYTIRNQPPPAGVGGEPPPMRRPSVPAVPTEEDMQSTREAEDAEA